MARITKILLLVCASSVAIAVVCISFFDLYWGFVYELSRNPDRAVSSLWQVFDVVRNPDWFLKCYSHQSFLRGFFNLLFLGVAFSLCWISRRKLFPISAGTIARTLWTDISETVPLLRLTTLLVAVVVNGILLWGIVHCSSMAIHYGLRDLAYAADAFGAYEVGEQIYSVTSDSIGTTLASTCGFTGHDSDRHEVESARLNRTVEKIYGAHSLQMANRFRIYAGHLQSNFEDLKGAEQFRKKAIALYVRLGRPIEAAENLAFLAFIQAELKHFDDANRSIDRALNLVRNESVVVRACIAHLVYTALYEMGDRQRGDVLLKEFASLKIGSERENGHPALIVTAFLVFLFAVDRLLLLGKKALLNALALSWTKQLGTASKCDAKAFWLNKLINLELFRKRWEAADRYSRELVRCAERL